MKVLIKMRQALSDAAVLAGALPGDSWRSWRILLIAAAGEALNEDERPTFTALTGREREPGELVEVMLTVAGRRSGKTKAMSVFCTWLAACVDWSDCLSLGERAACLFLSPVERQASVAHDYCAAMIDSVEMFAAQVVNRTASVIELHNRIDLRTEAANWRHNRGSTCIAICLDKSAFFHGDASSNSDAEIVTALKPSLSSTDGPLLMTSSPAAMEGVVYRTWKRHYGAQGDPRVLVVQADTRSLNPSLSQRRIVRAYAEDPVAADAEYGGVFRQPVSAYLARSVVEAAIEKGVEMRPRLPGIVYTAFVDPSGGNGSDSFTGAIGHVHRDDERDVCVVDALLEVRPPFDPFVVTREVTQRLQLYGITFCHGDGYAGDWPTTAFAKHGIAYQKSHLTTSENYLHVVPLWIANRVLMLDVPRATDQICSLQRKIGSAGRETVEHPRGAHDDLACAIAGLLARLTPVNPELSMDFNFGDLCRFGGRPAEAGGAYGDADVELQNYNALHGQRSYR